MRFIRRIVKRIWRHDPAKDIPNVPELAEAIESPSLIGDIEIWEFSSSAPSFVEGTFRGMPFYFHARYNVWSFTLAEVSAAEHPNFDPSVIGGEQVGLFDAGMVMRVPDVRAFFLSGLYGRREYAASGMPEPHAVSLVRVCCYGYELATEDRGLPADEFRLGKEPVTVDSDAERPSPGEYAVAAIGHTFLGSPSPGIERVKGRSPRPLIKAAWLGCVVGTVLSVLTVRFVIQPAQMAAWMVGTSAVICACVALLVTIAISRGRS